MVATLTLKSAFKRRSLKATHDVTSLIHIESFKSPITELFEVDSRGISFVNVNTKEYHSECSGEIFKVNALGSLIPNVIFDNNLYFELCPNEIILISLGS
ncbi:hypothetical protein Tco_0059634 [Tanacetum coccineum]